MATIKLKNLKVKAIIGVFKHEQEKKQDLIINIEFRYSSLKASKSDLLEDTIDYQNLKRIIIRFVENSRFNLLEKLVEHILDIIMDFQLVEYAKVEIDKPEALQFVDSVSITSERKK